MVNAMDIFGVCVIVALTAVAFVIALRVYLHFQHKAERDFQGSQLMSGVILSSMAFTIMIIFLVPVDILSNQAK